ncbi:MAG: hypothetical protein P4L92_05465 [Rudaea sp.]|nr:hypothetical protein [Rudaea sp.]
MLDYLSEPATTNADNRLFVVNNTFVNDLGHGTFMQVGTATTLPILAEKDIFAGGGTICSPITPAPTPSHNYSGSNPMFVDAVNFDYRPLPGSPVINAGIDPGSGAGQSLVPTEEYVQSTSNAVRSGDGKIDIGAYEFDDIVKDGFGG